MTKPTPVESQPEPVRTGPQLDNLRRACDGVFDRLERFSSDQRAGLFYLLESRWCWSCGAPQSDHTAECPTLSPLPVQETRDEEWERLTKATLHAVHQALYHSLRLLERGWDAPLGHAADDARRALRRAWVATHDDPEYDHLVPEAEVERKMFHLWRQDRAREIESSDADAWLRALRSAPPVQEGRREEPGPQPEPDGWIVQNNRLDSGAGSWPVWHPDEAEFYRTERPSYTVRPFWYDTAPLPSPEGRERHEWSEVEPVVAALHRLRTNTHVGPTAAERVESAIKMLEDAYYPRALSPTESREEARDA